MENVKQQARRVIVCPHCGYEYLPGEIFYPNNVVGQPTNIIRDTLGKILYEEYLEGKEPLAEEQYCCDNCGRPFVVEVDAHYKVREEIEELDFSNTTATLF